MFCIIFEMAIVAICIIFAAACVAAVVSYKVALTMQILIGIVVAGFAVLGGNLFLLGCLVPLAMAALTIIIL